MSLASLNWGLSHNQSLSILVFKPFCSVFCVCACLFVFSFPSFPFFPRLWMWWDRQANPKPSLVFRRTPRRCCWRTGREPSWRQRSTSRSRPSSRASSSCAKTPTTTLKHARTHTQSVTLVPGTSTVPCSHSWIDQNSTGFFLCFFFSLFVRFFFFFKVYIS